MRWSRAGLVFRPPGHGWLASHAQNPFPEALPGSRVRVHFAARDAANRARGGSFVLDLEDRRVLELTSAPVLDLGELGAFDDSGAMPSCIVERGGEKWMYYTGWIRQVETPFSFSIGLAVSTDGGLSYRRFSPAPVLARSAHDPYLTASPWVLAEEDGFRMWYVSATRWELVEEGPPRRLRHYYHIRHARSADGVRWETDGRPVIDFRGDEFSIARPVVVRDGGRYRMWYCFRGGDRAYRAGYAESADGLVWTRKDDQAGLDASPEGWDSGMISYPCAFRHQGRWWMLYNGNDYGRDGVGLASGPDLQD